MASTTAARARSPRARRPSIFSTDDPARIAGSIAPDNNYIVSANTRDHHGSRACGLLRDERIYYLHARFFEVDAVARRYRESVDQRGGSNQAVFYRHGSSRSAQRSEQYRPPETYFGIPREALQPRDAISEPSLQSLPPSSSREQEN